MKIAIVGLGLIGGSLCKALSAKTSHKCYGIDTDRNTIQAAIHDGAILKAISESELSEMDVTVVCLHPKQTVEFILANKKNFKEGSIVVDSCGVKGSIVSAVFAELEKERVHFIGCHPMAGREFSGYAYSLATLFEKASLIITPNGSTPAFLVEIVKDTAAVLGFGKVVVSTPEEHDRTIAFTSQLAHVVSNAYIKSPTLRNQSGFSAGSFQDLTRVAKLNEDMWTDLFIMNKSALLNEIDVLLENLEKYRQAIENEDSDELKELLREGKILKENSNS